MDIYTPMTVMQVTLIWILLSLLLAWTLFFALLALRSEKKPAEPQALPYTPHTPALSTSTSQTPANAQQQNEVGKVPARV